MNQNDPITAWEVITPQAADAYLVDYNKCNRSLSIDRAIRYAEDIEHGKWITTHQGIAFDLDGVLIDGAHRLAAITMAGLPIKLLVTRGLPKEARLVVDQGKSRTIRDAIVLDGGKPIKGDVVGMAKYLILAPTFSARIAWSPAMVREILSINSDLVDEVEPLFPKKKKIRAQGVLMALLAKAWEHACHPDIIKFAKLLRTGEGTGRPVESSVIKFRDWLLGSIEARQAGAHGPRAVYQKAQAALRAYLDGKVLLKIYAVSEDLFPLDGRRIPGWVLETTKRFGVANRIETAKELKDYDPQKRSNPNGSD